MVKILLIQLDRFGDNLFVVPLIKGIRNRYPDSHITVLVRREFKDIMESYKDVDAVEVADWLELPAGMKGLDETEIIIKGYQRLKYEMRNLKESGFNLVFNLNFNKMTTLITSILDVYESTGFTVGSDGERVTKGLWANYMGCVVQTRNYNPLHIVDVYRNFEQGLPVEDMSGFMIDKSSEEYAEKLLKESGITDSTTVIAFQPGASNRRRIWPKEKFSQLARFLSEIGIKIVILGTNGEKDISYKIKSENPGVIDLTGKTTFSQLAAILKRCKILISNDTGTAHLASAVGTRVIGLYMCHAYPIETGPYGRGHITISPTVDCYPCKWKDECHYNYKCRNNIAPEDVLSVVNWVLFPDKSLNCKPENIDVNISIFDEDGFISYIPLIKRSLKFDDILRMIYKRIWKDMLIANGNLHLSFAQIHWLRETYEIEHQDLFKEKLEDVLLYVKQIESLAEEGINKSGELISYIFASDKRELNLIQSGIEELKKIDSIIAGIVHESEAVSPLSTFFSMQKDNITADNPFQVLRDSSEVYKSLKLNASRFCYLSNELITALFQNDRKSSEVLCSPYV